MVDFTQKAQYTVEDLRRIVALLRAPGGCPWDGAQTHESIRRNFIEEAYEVAEAIDEQNPAHLKEELGDVLLQVVFHASLEEDAGRFDLDDVADGICKKLIFRHPHVFGDGGEGTAESWEALKRREKGQTTYTATLEAVAKSLPGLWRRPYPAGAAYLPHAQRRSAHCRALRDPDAASRPQGGHFCH